MKTFLNHLAISALAVFAPVIPVLLAMLALIGIDFVSGVWRSTKKGDKFTSNRAKRTVAKFALYVCAVLAAFLLETFIMPDVMPITKMIAGFIGLVEVKSVLENVQSVTGVDFTSIINKLHGDNEKRE